MKAKILFPTTALGLACFLLSGCYTVLQGPKTAADLQRAQELSQGQEKWEEAPTLGRFQDRPDPWNDFYYPNAPAGTYGFEGYGGYPLFGFDSRYGLYGAALGSPYGYGQGYYPYGYGQGYYPYGYGYGPSSYYGYGPSSYYGYGADPYGYGADPYYRDGSGYYVPPGYELVSIATLNQLRAAEQALSTQPAVDTGALRREERRRAERLWDQREQPRRTRPAATSRPAPSSSGSAKPKSSKPASTSEEKGSTKPKRRGGR